MTRFKNLWNMELDWWDSDIDEIENQNWSKNIFKKYHTKSINDNPSFTIEDIKKYHKTQNETKLIENEIVLQNQITLLWNKINKIVISILKLDENEIYLASDIKTQEEIIITNPTYIEWKGFNEYLKYIECTKATKIKEILINNIKSDKLYYPINSWSFLLSQISTFNIKVLKIENKTMYLIITDLAQKIKEIIK